MNAVQDLALTVEHVKICQEATDASAKQDFLENIAKQVVFHVNSFFAPFDLVFAWLRCINTCNPFLFI